MKNRRAAIKATGVALIPFLLAGLGEWYPGAAALICAVFLLGLGFAFLWAMAYGAFGGE